MRWSDLVGLAPARPAPLAVRGVPSRSLDDLIARQARAARATRGRVVIGACSEGALIIANVIVSRCVVRQQQPGCLRLADVTRVGDEAPLAVEPGAAEWPSPVTTLADFRARGHVVRLLGLADRSGTSHYILRLGRSDGAVRDYALDARRFVLRRAHDVCVPAGGPPLAVLWEDFRTVEGVLLPFGEEERRLSDGALLRTWQWRTIRLTTQ
jgi:hypothetical protein